MEKPRKMHKQSLSASASVHPMVGMQRISPAKTVLSTQTKILVQHSITVLLNQSMEPNNLSVRGKLQAIMTVNINHV